MLIVVLLVCVCELASTLRPTRISFPQKRNWELKKKKTGKTTKISINVFLKFMLTVNYLSFVIRKPFSTSGKMNKSIKGALSCKDLASAQEFTHSFFKINKVTSSKAWSWDTMRDSISRESTIIMCSKKKGLHKK